MIKRKYKRSRQTAEKEAELKDETGIAAVCPSGSANHIAGGVQRLGSNAGQMIQD
jgi:hypothetical protein